MKKTKKSRPKRASDNKEVLARVAELEETLRAIRMGEVDAVVVSGPTATKFLHCKVRSIRTGFWWKRSMKARPRFPTMARCCTPTGALRPSLMCLWRNSLARQWRVSCPAKICKI